MEIRTNRKQIVKYVLVGFVILIVLGAVGFRFVVQRSTTDETLPDVGVHLTGIRLVGRHKGERQWEVASHTMTQEDALVHFHDIEQVVIFKDDEPRYYVQAERGVLHRASNDLELYGRVLVEDDHGFWLRSEELLWYAEPEHLVSPVAVEMRYEDATIYANEMLTDVPGDETTLTGDVLIVDEDRRWTMPRLVYAHDTETMNFFGSTTIEQVGEGDDLDEQEAL